MKKTYLFLCLIFLFGISVKTTAQVAPSEDNLTHQWTFDDGTANDSKGTLNGTLEGNATIKNNALNTSTGGYVILNATDLAVNTYTQLSMEVWFTSVATANGSFHMLYYFGDTNAGGNGENYTCVTPARGGDQNFSRAMISTGVDGSGAEDGINGTEYDDGILHHMVCVINEATITFYIDGINIGATDLTGTNSLGFLGTQFAYFAKGGYTHDPTWKGLIHKISMYDTALTDENVTYLYQHGAEDNAVITSSVSSFVFDTNYPAATTTITGSNLTSPISITTPAGIFAQYNNVTVTSIPANSLNANVTFIYDGTTLVDGNITLTSGTITSLIQVKAVSESNCFTPLYNGEITNLINDPGMNTLAQFVGWGTKTVETLISNSDNVYCGASSVKVGAGTNTGGGTGSLDFHPHALLTPSTTYRVKLMAKTTGGVFRVGIERIDLNNSANNMIMHEFNTNEQWQPVDFYFTTGDLVDPDPVIYINNWELSGQTALIDNWEIYPTTDPLIFPSVTSVAFDPDYLISSMDVTSVNLTDNITITAPSGITLDQTTLTANTLSVPLTVSWDGTTAVTGNITLASGSTTVSIPVKTVATANASCFTPLYTDRSNLIADPYFNDKTNFNGWAHSGSWGMINVVDNPDSVYCGSHSAKLFSSADIEVPLTGLLIPNSGYVARAMVRTFGGYFHMGINGENTAIPGDKVDSISTDGAWQQMTFNFNTGETLSDTPVLFFNNDRNTGRVAYLDNWELYKKDELNAVVPVKDLFEKLYVQNGKIVADFVLDQSTNVQLTVYTVTGSIVSDEKIAGTAGLNHQVVKTSLPSGMYMVKIMKNGVSSFRKLIK